MKYLFLSLFCLLNIACFAQFDSIKREITLRDKVLNDIQNTFNNRTQSIDSTVTKLDQRLSSLDKSIAQSKDANDKADKLQQRVQAVEAKQKAIEQNELNLFQANYQSAMVNLVSMDREIKPLLLFNSTKSFLMPLVKPATR
ncbi:hypothetical protein [Niabella ginsengisoli]|uniref:OmpH family outer membrane protein n=1 Tax=Niabella ginsengisoli TaxID=522298 RepID=A0ABS9SLB0_9BACT|nr:hypothetical protein [Niabella ginsengisoli]MCH5599154.1 hypothetical protein [Niabella ginsengisoli]